MELADFCVQRDLVRHGAFKEHCILGFWKGSLMFGERDGKAQEAAGHFGRITKVADLPSKKILSGYIKEAMQLNENGVKPSARPPRAPPNWWFPTTWPPPCKKRQGAGHLRGFQSQQQARVCRVDHRGQDRGHSVEATRNRHRVDGRGQAEELEIYELLGSIGAYPRWRDREWESGMENKPTPSTTSSRGNSRRSGRYMTS